MQIIKPEFVIIRIIPINSIIESTLTDSRDFEGAAPCAIVAYNDEMSHYFVGQGDIWRTKKLGLPQFVYYAISAKPLFAM